MALAPTPRPRPLAPAPLCPQGGRGPRGGGREQVPPRSPVPETLLPVAQGPGAGLCTALPPVLAPARCCRAAVPGGGRVFRQQARLPGPGDTEGTRTGIRGGLSGTGPGTIAGGAQASSVRWPRRALARGLQPGVPGRCQVWGDGRCRWLCTGSSSRPSCPHGSPTSPPGA